MFYQLRLVDSHRRAAGKLAEGTHAANAIPRIELARHLALAFVALHESRHKDFFSERRQADAPGLAVIDKLTVVIELDHLDDRTRLRRIVADLVIFRSRWILRAGQSHERVAVGGRHVDVRAE